jgi:hypothetical protein
MLFTSFDIFVGFLVLLFRYHDGSPPETLRSSTDDADCPRPFPVLSDGFDSDLLAERWGCRLKVRKYDTMRRNIARLRHSRAAGFAGGEGHLAESFLGRFLY